MKRRIFAIAVILICFSLAVGGTWAYFNAEDVATNVITSGGIDISVEEYQLIEGELLPYPDDVIGIMPGTVVSKIVTVKSLEMPAYIRASVDVELENAEGVAFDLTKEELNELVIIQTGEEWLDGNDGYYYYNGAIGTEEYTAPLFEEVTFSGPNMTNEYQNSTATITITAQAVQQANNPIPTDGTVCDVLGWE